jgi:hypothetical protein
VTVTAALAVFYFVVAVCLHGGLARLHIPLNIVAKFVLPGGVLGLLLIWHLVGAGGVSVASLAGILLYALLCELYIFLFTFVISSVSAKILFSMLQRSMTTEELNAAYDTSGMVAQRLVRLQATHLIWESGGVLRLTPKGLYLYRAFRVFKRFFGHERK